MSWGPSFKSWYDYERAHEREYTLQLINKKENRVKLPCSDPNCECKKGGLK